MRKISILFVALSLLSNCAGTTPATIGTSVAQIQQAAVTFCGFLPTAATVSGILATLVPSTVAVEQLIASTAQQICAAVAPLASKTAGLTAAKKIVPTVNGVVVHGKFVR